MGAGASRATGRVGLTLCLNSDRRAEECYHFCISYNETKSERGQREGNRTNHIRRMTNSVTNREYKLHECKLEVHKVVGVEHTRVELPRAALTPEYILYTILVPYYLT